MKIEIIKKVSSFLRESWMELKKVSWLDSERAIQYTIVVIVITLSVALFLGILDYLLNFFLRKFVL